MKGCRSRACSNACDLDASGILSRRICHATSPRVPRPPKKGVPPPLWRHLAFAQRETASVKRSIDPAAATSAVRSLLAMRGNLLGLPVAAVAFACRGANGHRPRGMVKSGGAAAYDKRLPAMIRYNWSSLNCSTGATLASSEASSDQARFDPSQSSDCTIASPYSTVDAQRALPEFALTARPLVEPVQSANE